mmetsp:Transcript_28967/g.73962  ORF Transcript_28967/g.73962 Transcript_28967/m.73962 type:complete len:362 (-) Transcript_28967:762-1847(-)
MRVVVVEPLHSRLWAVGKHSVHLQLQQQQVQLPAHVTAQLVHHKLRLIAHSPGVHQQPQLVRALRGARALVAGAIPPGQQPLVGADGVRVLCNAGQLRVRQRVGATRGPRLHQLHQRDARLPGQLAQHARVKRLDVHGLRQPAVRVDRPPVPVLTQRAQHNVLDGGARVLERGQAVVPRRVLHLGVHAHCGRVAARHADELLQAHQGQRVVARVVPEPQRLPRAQLAHLLVRQVAGKHACERLAVNGLGGDAVLEQLVRVGRVGQPGRVAADGHQVLGQHHVALDEVGALRHRLRVRLRCVLWQLRGRAAVAHHQRPPRVRPLRQLDAGGRCGVAPPVIRRVLLGRHRAGLVRRAGAGGRS